MIFSSFSIKKCLFWTFWIENIFYFVRCESALSICWKSIQKSVTRAMVVFWQQNGTLTKRVENSQSKNSCSSIKVEKKGRRVGTCCFNLDRSSDNGTRFCSFITVIMARKREGNCLCRFSCCSFCTRASSDKRVCFCLSWHCFASSNKSWMIARVEWFNVTLDVEET